MAQEEHILEIQQDVIETLCKDAREFLDSDKTKTFEDGVSFGYNTAMKLCVNEISRLRNELAKAGKQLGGFYNPATSVKIPESFGTPSVIEPLKL